MEILSDTRFSAGTVIADRYEVDTTIGAGGMGLVLLVRDRQLSGEATALKLLHPHIFLSEKSFSRFQNEVLIMRQLTHQNIVRIFDMGKTERGEPFISMEHVNGTNLLTLLRSTPGGILNFEHALGILRQIAKGMEVAHGGGIVHRDLKPENILITAEGVVKLADFGIARIAGNTQGLTTTGESLGTPYYMSPEQIREEEVDPRADIYSFGILAFELAAGHRPFEGNSFFSIFSQHLSQPIPTEELRKIGVPRWYAELVEKCCEKDRSRRFSSATELLEVIDSQLSGSAATGLSILSFSERKRKLLNRTIRSFERWPVLVGIIIFSLTTSIILVFRESDILAAFLARPLFAIETHVGISPEPFYSLLSIDYRPTSDSLDRVVTQLNRRQTEYAVKAILSAGVNPDIPAHPGGRPPLHAAIREGTSLAVESLLRGGANPDIEFQGQTALTLALANDKTSIIGVLLEHTANPLLPDGKGEKTLEAITAQGREAIAPDLLKKVLTLKPEIQLNVVFADKTTPLTRAIRSSNEPLIRILLEGPAFERADPLFPEGDGITPLQLATEINYKPVRLLLETAARSE